MSTGQLTVIDAPLPCAPGLRIAMRVQGEGDPLLLMNGMTRPMQSWDPFIQALHGRTIISFDAPGVGASRTLPRPLSITELATLAVAVLDAAGFERADVLGYSHGGAIAQEMACRTPERVRALVLAATSCGVGATPGSQRDLLHSMGSPVDATAWPFPDLLGMFWQSLAMSNWSSIPFLGSIQTPTLVVCGGRDRIVPPANSRVLAGRIPDATLLILDGKGHDLQRQDNATLLAPVVDRFLRAGTATLRLRACGLPA
jgi:pimeloyl-ACP methyl ester carboxylesterase